MNFLLYFPKKKSLLIFEKIFAHILSNNGNLLKIKSSTAVGIAQSVNKLATCWTVRGSNPGGRRDFPHPSRPTLEPTQPPVQWVPELSWV